MQGFALLPVLVSLRLSQGVEGISLHIFLRELLAPDYDPYFNPRTRVGCDPEGGSGIVFYRNFNPRTRVGCDNISGGSLTYVSRFQSTHPRGVRPYKSAAHEFIGRDFNPRTRVGCDSPLPHLPFPSGRFQSTHPRGVRRSQRGDEGRLQRISIHAPAWGATGQQERLAEAIRISIHAPAWGATVALHVRDLAGEFQSTHPRGVRRHLPDQHRHKLKISIHAPAWGATRKYSQSRHRRKISIHAPAWGATIIKNEVLMNSDISIHAPAWGATPAYSIPTLGDIFQSTHPRGVRQGRRSRGGGGERFQSTHPRGVRHANGAKVNTGFLTFQSTHPRGVRHQPCGDGATPPRNFNPRTRVGCDELRELREQPEEEFQSTHPRGVRR